jgi:hypothetical protein
VLLRQLIAQTIDGGTVEQVGGETDGLAVFGQLADRLVWAPPALTPPPPAPRTTAPVTPWLCSREPALAQISDAVGDL